MPALWPSAFSILPGFKLPDAVTDATRRPWMLPSQLPTGTLREGDLGLSGAAASHCRPPSLGGVSQAGSPGTFTSPEGQTCVRGNKGVCVR